MKFKNIIFDLDGVLIDSKSNMNKSWSNTSRKYNLNIKFNKYENLLVCLLEKYFLN
jgi:beta-phosphoglucomutase-like phosphatase (HAD superfamily)